jgi:hypothetical protein
MSESVVAELTAIREQYGTLNPEVVVLVATDPNHPLHNRFEWDDAVAGHKHRLQQAGALLRVVKLPNDGSHPRDLRAFVAVKGAEQGRADYVPTTEALSDPFTRALILRQMEREWKSMQQRYGAYAEFAALIAAAQSEQAV